MTERPDRAARPERVVLPAGFLLVDKPAGMSSFDIVFQVRRALPRGTKVGHAGTLDPFATGLLVVLVGVATRLMPWVVGHDKRYLLDALLGARSDSDDVTGVVELLGERPAVTRDRLDAAIAEELARTEQLPPQVSAIHVDGERAYKVARRGEQVAVRPRPIRFDAIDLVDWQPDGAGVAVEVGDGPTSDEDRAALSHLPRLRLDVRCATGTYLRALARDLGERLGTAGVAAELRRTEVGDWTLDGALTLQARPSDDERLEEAQVRGAMHGIDELLPDAPIAQLRKSDARLVTAGGRIGSARVTWARGEAPPVHGTTKSPAAPVDEQPIVLACGDVVLGVAAHVVGRDGTSILQPRVVDPAAAALLRRQAAAAATALATGATGATIGGGAT